MTPGMSVPAFGDAATPDAQNRRNTSMKTTHRERLDAYLSHAATVLAADASAQLAILHFIASHAGPDFVYKSGRRRIADALWKPRRVVQRQIAALEAAGLLRREPDHSCPAEHATRYVLTVTEVSA